MPKRLQAVSQADDQLMGVGAAGRFADLREVCGE